jgi:hypothetical protein
LINQQPDNQIGSDAGTYGGNQISGKQQFQLSQLQITHFGFQMHTMELDKRQIDFGVQNGKGCFLSFHHAPYLKLMIINVTSTCFLFFSL